MRSKKKLLFVEMFVFFFIFLTGQTFVQAMIATEPIYLGINELKTKDTPNLGYSIGIPGNENTAKIWNIVKYSTARSSGVTDINGYYLKSGVGSNDVNKRAKYNVFYNMKTERESIKAQNEVLRELVEGIVTKQSGEIINKYDAILAISDTMYVPGDSTDAEKEELIKKILQIAMDPTSIYNPYVKVMESYPLTDDDITAIQQAAIWYFTNNENPEIYDKTGVREWLGYTLNGVDYDKLSAYTPNGELPQYDAGQARTYQAEILYNYIISQAEENANRYSTATSNVAPAQVNETNLQSEILGTRYIVGPFNITENTKNPTPYTIDFMVESNNVQNNNYKLLNKNKKEYITGISVKDLVGESFYISLPLESAGQLKVNININYSDVSLKLWASTTNNAQKPVMVTGKENISVPNQVQIELEELREFDFKLTKKIVAINNQNIPERIENIDVSKLNTTDVDDKMITTANYKINKEPVGVKKGDIVTYTFRIYNEGTIDGYVQKITEEIPKGLEFMWSEKEGKELKNDLTLTDEEKEAIEFNQEFLWGNFIYDTNGERIIQISSDYLSKENETTVKGNLIPAFGLNNGKKVLEDLSYKEISIKMKVISEENIGTIIKNEAAITGNCDENGNVINDRDSSTENWVKYEDNEDFDNIILQSFDLALRKFIVAISDDESIESTDYLKNQDGSYTRAPIVNTSELNTLNENDKLITTATYNHKKEPIIVQPNDTVVYMLRVYNEGEMDGYASEIKNYLPPYLEFVDSEFNQQYGWKISEDGKTVTTKYLKDSKINKVTQDSQENYVLSYKEVPIMCKVSQNTKTSINITNIAEITEYLDENKKLVADRDSQSNNVVIPKDSELAEYKNNETGAYVTGQQDDDDFEKIIVKIFDLTLKKLVTQAIVIEDGKQTATDTGHQIYRDSEEIVKVEVDKKKIEQVSVKFKYSIRVINEGEIAGYAKEVKDYIPEGFKMVEGENNGWIDKGNNIVATRLLENTLLKPGEYRDIEIVLTWINSQDNLGVKNNTAEISEDYNEYKVPDIDSVPDNKKAGEDDIDDAAPVMLSISTGKEGIYLTLGFIVVITIVTGTVVIKKYIL